MANTLTGLIPDIYQALDVVSREMVGFIPAVTLDASAERAALNQNIRIPITPAATASDVTPGQLPPNSGDQTILNNPLIITKARMVPFRWTGEEQKGVNTGVGYKSIRQSQIAQAIRTLVNEVEVDCASQFINASRVQGTPGTAPFATDLSDPAQLLKILKDNGTPQGDLQLVMDTTAGAKVRSLAQLTKANEAGTVALREQGVLLDIHGFKLRESAGINQVAASTGAAYVLNGAHAKGATTINVQTGTGTILAGEVVTIAGLKYIAATVLAAGSFTIGGPGLRAAVAGGQAVTVNTTAWTPNLAFSRSNFILATRTPALPEEGDSAEDRTIITDPISGMAFEFSMYTEYRQVHYEVSLAWGKVMTKANHAAVLAG